MGEFVKPWRRKAGCVTLVMACVFARGWLRSFDNLDFVNVVREGTVLLSLFSGFENCGGNLFISMDGSPDSFSTRLVTYRKTDMHSSYDAFERSVPTAHLWRLHFGGFDLGQSMSLGSLQTTLQAPYWSIIIPLSLLSGYLLLSKPRQAKKRTESP
jgi:hypothetical protein